MIKKGTFTSIWDNGTEITTSATLDTKTGCVETNSVESPSTDILDEECFVDEDNERYEICPVCHEYIRKTVMEEGVGKQLYEKQICSDPDCDSNDCNI